MRSPLALCAAALCIAACGGDEPSAPASPLLGVWRLQLLGGAQLPMTCLAINCPASAQLGPLGLRIDVLGSSLSLAADGVWSETLDIEVVTPTGLVRQARTIRGTYTVSGTRVLLNATDNRAYLTCEVISGALACDDGRARYAR